MLVVNERGDAPYSEKVVAGWLRSCRVPGIAVAGGYVPGRSGAASGQEADFIVFTAHACVCIEVKQILSPRDGKLSCPVNGRWSMTGYVGDPVHVRRTDVNPMYQARSAMFAMKALAAAVTGAEQFGVLQKPLGRAVLAHGAVGELGPIVAMSVLLTSRDVVSAVIVLVLFVAAAGVVWLVPSRLLVRAPRLGGVVTELAGGTAQLPVRVVFVLLLALMAVADEFDLDVVLGAFAAGVVLHSLVAERYPRIESSLETVGFGVLIPIFFVVSGMGIDPSAVARKPLTWVVFVLAIAVARGVPVWLSERFVTHGANLGSGRERVQLALYAATGLPIIVAVTQVAAGTGLMSAELASTLVAAGATTVLVFPALAKMLGRRSMPH
ncbi:cation:proton antiporter [Nocardia wallacei]|uniref:cation:proton antiporter n=1 Tax=Nocardia wallacei TaxID=480035 RepID=UPI002458C348|nr:cation:proton antiporter [Nocardia wallacei]